jgi:hypothetical protein
MSGKLAFKKHKLIIIYVICGDINETIDNREGVDKKVELKARMQIVLRHKKNVQLHRLIKWLLHEPV